MQLGMIWQTISFERNVLLSPVMLFNRVVPILRLISPSANPVGLVLPVFLVGYSGF